jgi:hypothetical protein
VKFELRHNEIGDAEEPEHYLAEDLGRLFTQIGPEAPQPVPVMRTDQLLEKGEDLNPHQVRATCVRLFEYR